MADHRSVATSAVQAAALLTLRPLLLFVATPLSLLFIVLEGAQNGPTAWLIVEGFAVSLMGLSLVGKRSTSAQALGFSVGLTLHASLGYMHFGATLGIGVLFCAAALVATFFHGWRGGLAAVGTLTFAVTLGVFGHFAGLIELRHPQTDLTAGVRLLAIVSITLSAITFVFYRVQIALDLAHERELVASTERELAERERSRALELALQAQRLEAAGRLAAGVAHDFNNALTVLRGAVELLGIETDERVREELVAEGVAAVEGASATARQLLDFARPGESVQGRSDPSVLLERFARSMRRVLPESIVLELEVEPCPEVPLARAVFEQIMVNLVINARDAISGAGTITLRCRTSDSEGAQIEIVDTGSGMSEETRRRLFEPFYTTKGEQQGTGLGLSMVMGFVTRSGGTIEVDSTLGQGSRFTLRWPSVDVPTTTRDSEAVSKAHSGAIGARVLLVEDNRDVARVMARTLKSAGYVVTTTDTLAAARAQLERSVFVVVCCDGVLPDGTALDLLDAYPRTPMLICTGYADRSELARAGERGVVVLRKPIAPVQLLDHITQVIVRAAGETA